MKQKSLAIIFFFSNFFACFFFLGGGIRLATTTFFFFFFFFFEKPFILIEVLLTSLFQRSGRFGQSGGFYFVPQYCRGHRFRTGFLHSWETQWQVPQKTHSNVLGLPKPGRNKVITYSFIFLFIYFLFYFFIYLFFFC